MVENKTSLVNDEFYRGTGHILDRIQRIIWERITMVAGLKLNKELVLFNFISNALKRYNEDPKSDNCKIEIVTYDMWVEIRLKTYDTKTLIAYGLVFDKDAFEENKKQFDNVFAFDPSGLCYYKYVKDEGAWAAVIEARVLEQLEVLTDVFYMELNYWKERKF